jgi:hypothetical protein
MTLVIQSESNSSVLYQYFVRTSPMATFFMLMVAALLASLACVLVRNKRAMKRIYMFVKMSGLSLAVE